MLTFVKRKLVGGPDVPWDPVEWGVRLQSGVVDPQRVASVKATGLLDAPLDESFDLLARLAAGVLGVPWVFLRLVDEHRSFCVSAAGVDPDPETGLYGESQVNDSFCQYVIGADGPVVIDDARLDPRSDRNPSIEAMGVVAWAGFPLRSINGHVVGIFCAVDRVPRQWSGEDITVLDALASTATSHLQLRATLALANEAADELRAELERRAVLVRRATTFAQLASELSAASTTEQVSRVVTTTGLEVFDAVLVDIAVVHADQRHISMVHSPLLPPHVAEKYVNIPLSADIPLAQAAARGQPVLVPDLVAVMAEYPHIVSDVIAAGLESIAAVPLFRAQYSRPCPRRQGSTVSGYFFHGAVAGGVFSRWR